MICKQLTEKVVMGWPLSIIWGNTLEEWVILPSNDFPGIVGEEQEWYLLQTLNSVARRLLEIQMTPPHGDPTLKSAHEPILVVTKPGVAETFKTVIDKMTHGTNFKLTNLLLAENANITQEDPNTIIDEPENQRNIHLVSYNSLPSRATESSNGRLSYCLWSAGICDESHLYKTRNCVGRGTATIARSGIKYYPTTTPRFHSLYDWYYQVIWLFSGAPEDSEVETVMEKHGADALYSAVKCLLHAICTEDEDSQHNAAHRMIQIANPWMIRRWSESKLANGKPLIRIPKNNAHLVDLELTENEQAILNTLVERYTTRGASGTWRVRRWRLACVSLVLGDSDGWNDVPGQWYNEWPPDTEVGCPILRWLRESFLTMLVKEPAEYSEPDQDEASDVALLHEADSLKSTLPRVPPPPP
jgi:hypothetical protein